MPDEDKNAGPEPFTGARWGTEDGGVEAIGAVSETEDHTSPEQRARNAEAERIRAASLALAQRLAAAGTHDDDDEAEADGTGDDAGSARKD